MKPKFFSNPSAFRRWLLKNHETQSELWVGFYKKHSGKPSITWPESVDQALCFGWIDGIRKSIDDVSYMIRFTPRRATSIWSAVNIGKVGELTTSGLMHPAGIAAFEKRSSEKSLRYSYEQQDVQLDKPLAARFRADRAAWRFFQEMPPSYRKPCVWWVMSAKKDETRARRLQVLIDCSREGKKIPQQINQSKPRRKK